MAGLHDEDLTEKAEAERVGKPTTVDGFKCADLSTFSTCLDLLLGDLCAAHTLSDG